MNQWKWHSSQRKDRDQKFMDLEKEWAQQVVEKFLPAEEQREERNYQLRSHSMWPFFFAI